MYTLEIHSFSAQFGLISTRSQYSCFGLPKSKQMYHIRFFLIFHRMGGRPKSSLVVIDSSRKIFNFAEYTGNITDYEKDL